MSTRRAIVAATISAMVAAGGGAALAQPGGHAGHKGSQGNRAKRGLTHVKRLDRRAVKRGMRFAGRAIHSETVVPTKDGTFATATFDRGTVTGVAGDQLSLKEGTKTATYKTVALTVSADAKVVVNGKKATLADVKADQLAIVLQGPKNTLVLAHDAHPAPTPATP